MQLLSILLLAALLVCVGNTAFALNPAPSFREKVSVKHQACQQIVRLAKKYEAEEVFPEGCDKGSTTSLDLAMALDAVTNRMAEMVAEEGAATVAQEDVALIELLWFELRTEMIHLDTRTFQMRNELLGTRLHALTKNISMSGGMVGVLQGSLRNQPENRLDAVGRGDLLLNFKVGENTIAVIDMSATGGDGIDTNIPSFSTLNGIAGSTEDKVQFREAWIEHSAYDNRLLLRVGKIDLYFDQNNIANDEISQFLSNAFVNSAILGAPLTGPGIRLQAQLGKPLVFISGYGSGDGDSNDLTDHGFGFAELDYNVRLGKREGNYRFYVTADGALPDEDNKLVQGTAIGYGTSIDQQLSDKLTVFGRYGWHDDEAYVSIAAWSAGLQYLGLFPKLKENVLGLAYGQVRANYVTSQEKLAEMYYKVTLTEQIDLSLHLQYLINAGGDRDKENVFVGGLRTHVVF